MVREMLRAKIHRITVTETEVDYEGSLTLDAELLRAADMLPFEKVDVYDVDGGSRFTTYLIEGEPGSGACCVNGAAARLTAVGHRLIVASYASLEESEARTHRPWVVLVDAANRIREVKRTEGAAVRFGG